MHREVSQCSGVKENESQNMKTRNAHLEMPHKSFSRITIQWRFSNARRHLASDEIVKFKSLGHKLVP